MARVLIADESKVIRTVCEWVFKHTEHAATAVESGTDAVRSLQHERFDVFVLDYTLPDQDAYQLCRALKSQPDTAQVAILMLGGAFAAFDANKASDCGADDTLMKPFKADDLFQKVSQLATLAASGQVRSLLAAPARQPEPSYAQPEPAYEPSYAQPEPVHEAPPQPEPEAARPRFQFPGRSAPAPAAAPAAAPSGAPKRFQFPGQGSQPQPPPPSSGQPRMAMPESQPRLEPAPRMAPQAEQRMASPVPQPPPQTFSPPPQRAPEIDAPSTPATPPPSVPSAGPAIDEVTLRAEVQAAVRELLPGIVRNVLKELIVKEVTPQLQRWVENKVEQLVRR